MSGPKGSSVDYEAIRRQAQERAAEIARQRAAAFNRFHELERMAVRYNARYTSLKATHNHTLPNNVEAKLKQLKNNLINSGDTFDSFNRAASLFAGTIESEARDLEKRAQEIEAATHKLKEEIKNILTSQNAAISEFNSRIKDLFSETGLVETPLESVDDLIRQNNIPQTTFNLAHLQSECTRHQANSKRVSDLLEHINNNIRSVRKSKAKLNKLLKELEQELVIINRENMVSFTENELIINNGITYKTLEETITKAMERLAIYLESRYRISEALETKIKIEDIIADPSLPSSDKVASINLLVSTHCSSDLHLGESVRRYQSAFALFCDLLAQYDQLSEDLEVEEEMPLYRYDHLAIHESNEALQKKVNSLLQKKAIRELLALYETRMADQGYELLNEVDNINGVTKLYSFGQDTGLEITVTENNELFTKVVGYEDENGATEETEVVAKMDEFCQMRDEIHEEAAKTIPVTDKYKLPSNVAYVEHVKRPSKATTAPGRSKQKRQQRESLLARHLTNY